MVHRIAGARPRAQLRRKLCCCNSVVANQSGDFAIRELSKAVQWGRRGGTVGQTVQWGRRRRPKLVKGVRFLPPALFQIAVLRAIRMMQQGNKQARLQLRLHQILVIRMSGSVSKSLPYMAAELAAGLP